MWHIYWYTLPLMNVRLLVFRKKRCCEARAKPYSVFKKSGVPKDEVLGQVG